MPKAPKHAALLNILPTARQALDLPGAADRTDVRDALAQVLDYAKEQAEQGIARNIRDKALGGHHTVRVSKAFREHVHAALNEDSATLSDVVEKNFHDFLDGSWTPGRPTRKPRGSATGTGQAKVGLNMRLKDPSLWEHVNTLGADPAEVAKRGYKLTAEAVARAALEETFGLPESEQENSATTA